MFDEIVLYIFLCDPSIDYTIGLYFLATARYCVLGNLGKLQTRVVIAFDIRLK